jgi:glycosyltransferase involved in cell wall biosynthesis
MRIGIDYLQALVHPPGVGRYVRELVRALVGLDDRPDLALFEVGRGERVVDPHSLGLTIGDPRVVRVQRNLPRSCLRLAHSVAGRGADVWLGGVDVFHHALPFAVPVTRARQTVALAELPAEGSEEESNLRAWLADIDLVFVFSDAFRSQVIQRLGLAPARVVRVNVGCDHWRRTLTTLGPRAVPPRILVLGTVRASRRPLVVLRAFEHLCASGLDARLEICDLPGAEPDPMAEALEEALLSSPVADKVLWTSPGEARKRGIVPDRAALEQSMPERIAAASVLVHLSAEEGTPVTPLEALAVGVPVVVSRIGAFEEALGGVAELVDDDECQREPGVLAEAIGRALGSHEDGQAVARREVVARAYTWERCARETLDAWTALARPGGEQRTFPGPRSDKLLI